MSKSPNKIAIVHDFLLKLGGAENLLQDLLKVFPNSDIYTLLYSEEGTLGKFKNYNVQPSILQHGKTPPKNFKTLLPRFPKAIESFDLSNYDLVISHSNSFAHGVITGASTKHICYCLSPTRYLYDWKNEYLIENDLFRGIKHHIVNKILSDLRLWDQEAATRPDKYIAISEHVRNRIRKYYRLDADVVYPAVRVEQIEPNLAEHEDYYLIISRLTPYKKIDLAVKAFNQLNKTLVIIGTGEDENRLKSIAKSNIEFLGWQSDKSIFEYLRNAKAFIFPGEEDFGLTPVESLAAGTPVIAYQKGGVVESIRDGIDGLFFDQPTAQSLVDAVKHFESGKIEFDPRSLRIRAEQFSFEKFKNHFLEAINNHG